MDHLYDVYAICEEKGFNDLTYAVAQYRVDHELTAEQDKATREFIGKHSHALAVAYARKDREHFNAVVADLIAADEADK